MMAEIVMIYLIWLIMILSTIQEEIMSKTKKILIGVLCVFLLAVGAIGVYAFKVYNDVTQTTDKMYEKLDKKEEVREKPVNIDKGQDPFSVLLLGVYG